MGTKWASNLYFPVKLSDEQMQTIPHPNLEMHIHVTYKTIEAGTFLGMGIFGPITAAVRKQNVLAGAMKGGRYGALVGVVAGPLLTYMKFRGQATHDELWDRCYRLRMNRNQVRVDRMVTWAAVGGGIATAVLGRGILDGTLVGIVVGTFGAAAFNMIVMKGDKTK